MAIQFARCEYVSRSTGGNACRKASYNQREEVRCERTGELFSFKERDGNVHHEILLPQGAAEKFKTSSSLWNEVEACERRINSQVAKEFVIALPDDTEVTLEDRIELTRRFGKIFVERGVAVQLDVHSPHDSEKNWHAHLLVTTRRFSEDGLSLGEKARDLDPVIRGGKVVEANIWGEIWRDLQNAYFEEKGYDLRVDPIGIIPQEHLGPVRMRHHMNEAIARSQLLQKSNEKLAQDPECVLEEMTHHRSVFSQKDIECFLQKHVPLNERVGLLEKVVEHPDVLPLYDKENGQKTAHFTTKQVRAEEEKLLRFADGIANKSTFALPSNLAENGLEGKTLSQEQKTAFDMCVSSEQNLCIIQGRAGVGKSYVLNAIRTAHEASCFRVLGLAPTHKVAMDLRQDGFKEAKTCHSFLFAFKNGREKLDSNTLVVVDEAGMLGTTLSVELFNVIKNSGAKLVLVGDDRQLSSVERGGTFKFLSERYGAAELRDVRRQSVEWQKAVSEALAEGKIKDAVYLLEENKAISWTPTAEESLTELLKDWSKDNLLKPHETRQIITQKNVDVDALNQGVRDILRSRGKLGDTEIVCTTLRGRVAFAEGDRVQFTKTDKAQDLMNASFGMIEHIDLKTKKLTIRLDNKEVKEVNPDTYDGLRHGYASTVYKAQGSTLDHVYVLHSKTATQSTNYVALTRQAKSLHLYVSQDETPSEAALIHQMGRQDGLGTSLVFNTIRDIERSQEEKPLSTQLKHGAEALVTKVKDVFHRNEQFYQFEKPANSVSEKAEFKVPDLQNNQESNLPYQSEKTQPLQEKKAQETPQSVSSLKDIKILSRVIDSKTVEEALKQKMSSFADDIFSSIGEPYNSASSSSLERRYGKNGHIAVNLKTGAWIDHKNSEMAGGPLHMLTKLKGLEFKEALEYGASWAGLSQASLSQTELSRVATHQIPRSLTSTVQGLEKEGAGPTEEEKVRIDRALALWDKGRPLQGTLAERYLREHRKIEGPLSNDLRYLPFFTDTNSNWSFPCLMAGARSPEGDVTAVQLTFLNAHTALKADIPVAKRSFGVLKGSAVAIQDVPVSNVLFLAEGVETALSLRSAGIQGTIKATLGLSHIKRIVPESLNTQIIICADHDAPDSPAAQSLEKSVLALKAQGLAVTVIKPDKLNEDFNDVLKNQGSQGVREILEQTLPKNLIKIMKHEKEVLSQNPVLEQHTFEKKGVMNSVRSPIQKTVEKTFPLNHANFKEKPVSRNGIKVFDELTKQCVQKLYAYLGEERRDLNPDLIKRVSHQSEKAASYIFHAHTLKGTNPTENGTKHFLLRAKYELDRIPEIRADIIAGWKKVNSYKSEKDELIAHMMAERQASVEGRLYLEAKQRGLKPEGLNPTGLTPSPTIPDLAKQEIKQNKATEARLSQDLIAKQRLSESAATQCAKDITRYMETHGQKPTAEQMSAMAQISRDLDKQGYDPSIGTHNIEYLRRRDGDLRFRDWSASNKDLSGFKDFPHVSQDYAQSQARVKSHVQEKTVQHEKVYEVELSM
ncbi:MAG: AAA family ATPase [Alphaproteobacteria bacterium]|nr:AAA family ATPase [Alphaproteobacteria bacterium]